MRQKLRMMLFETGSRKVNVSDATEAVPGTVGATRIESPKFDELIYWVQAPKLEFDFDKFKQRMPTDSADAFVTVAPKAGTSGPFSILCSWAEADDAFSFKITYYGAGWPHGADEHEPYAEEF